MTTGEEAGGGELAGVGEAEGVGIDPRRRLLVLGGDGGEEGTPNDGEEDEGGFRAAVGRRGPPARWGGDGGLAPIWIGRGSRGAWVGARGGGEVWVTGWG